MELNKYIDHTFLKANGSKENIIKLCEEAKEYNFKSVCVNPCNVSLAKEILKDSDVLVCTVVGFPLGQNTTSTKVFEAIDAIENGASEIDMVINVQKLKDKDYEYVLDEIKRIKKAIGKHTLKVIIETCYLNEEEIKNASLIALKAKANFVKTSTGFGTGGAKENDVKLMKETVKDEMEVKASGGVSSYEDALKMIEAGATRIGTSKGIEIIKGEK